MPPPESTAGGTAKSESIASIILGAESPKRPRGLLWAVVVTVAVHGLGGAMAWRAWSRLPVPAPVAARPKQTLKIDHVVELPPPPPLPPPAVPPPPPAPRPEAKPLRAKARAQAAPEAPASPPPPALAQAGQVVAAESDAPLDFTVVSGQGQQFAGGVTASSGTSTKAVETAAIPQGEPEGTGTVSRARAVQLNARNWSCPWPREADSLSVDEQTVVLRVTVTAEGRVTSADLLSDPGYGFGQAALACAREARFEAALDREGRPYATTSPPIRVRFRRR
ncbi:energy transducer TonB [Myxococcaceae bacterium GXIMD 01537]